MFLFPVRSVSYGIINRLLLSVACLLPRQREEYEHSGPERRGIQTGWVEISFRSIGRSKSWLAYVLRYLPGRLEY